MSDTPNIALPLLQAGQAQKHVTVNDAFLRLDALGAGRAKSASLAAPPVGAAEGDLYLVAGPATGEWAGRDGALAFFVGGGWEFAEPAPGRRCWIVDEGVEAVWLDGGWRRGAAGSGPFGAHLSAHTIGAEEAVQPGTGFDTALMIPDRAVVIGVTARVTAAIGGAGLTGWRLGVAGATDRYGSGLGIGAQSYAHGLTGQPVVYWSDTPLRIEPEGGDFSDGTIRFAIHFLSITPPDAV